MRQYSKGFLDFWLSYFFSRQRLSKNALKLSNLLITFLLLSLLSLFFYQNVNLIIYLKIIFVHCLLIQNKVLCPKRKSFFIFYFYFLRSKKKIFELKSDNMIKIFYVITFLNFHVKSILFLERNSNYFKILVSLLHHIFKKKIR